ncbi:MAG: hypothetical protein QXT86_13665 [Archaeoglobaceae archaeon]
MRYCVEERFSPFFVRYYCDWNDSYYRTYQECYNNCGIYLGDTLIRISQVDFTFIALLVSALFGLLVVYFMASSWS